eukprot:5421683-Prorocentrum_lima.AAC.1
MVAEELCMQQLVSEETGVACNTGGEAYRQVRRVAPIAAEAVRRCSRRAEAAKHDFNAAPG